MRCSASIRRSRRSRASDCKLQIVVHEGVLRFPTPAHLVIPSTTWLLSMPALPFDRLTNREAEGSKGRASLSSCLLCPALASALVYQKSHAPASASHQPGSCRVSAARGYGQNRAGQRAGAAAAFLPPITHHPTSTTHHLVNISPPPSGTIPLDKSDHGGYHFLRRGVATRAGGPASRQDSSVEASFYRTRLAGSALAPLARPPANPPTGVRAPSVVRDACNRFHTSRITHHVAPARGSVLGPGGLVAV